MEENNKAIDNENNEINEEELVDVAGGGKNEGWRKCFFTPKNNNVKLKGEVPWLECASSCFDCYCRWMSHCVDRWHRLEENHDLSPRDVSNHKKKIKPTYNT